MGVVWYIAAAASVVVAVSAATGWWRLLFVPFRLNPKRMTVDRLGLLFTSAGDVQRVNRLFESFVGGFNAMIARPSPNAWQQYADSLPSFCRPFAHEGAAMGYSLRHLGRIEPEAFEATFVHAHPGYRYLYYVGLGFWSGMRNHDADHLGRIVDGLDPLHGYLCYDGYGFKQTFFAASNDPSPLRAVDRLSGYAKNAAYHGVGRALWFRSMPRADLLIDGLTALGEHATDAASGVGLASVFVNPDRLGEACELAVRLPPAWHDDFHLGMCFGLKARSINDPAQFEIDLSRLAPARQEAIRASIVACDRIERDVREKKLGYRDWRVQVTDWMRQRIDYPLAGLRSTETQATPSLEIREATSVAG